ncbi:2-oxo acid dehydrogenase subunit E2 [Pelobacter seleniigenes]|uniref:2-oxo acid dehydrogenase subunit E2 n=1 Tax=Pelobacter seleniigenes TaxID=407188 RepID=UPI0004A6C156|nr:2-oxo acid dehydrogenase subunit E2 [Pelobacter seleniigenes]
MSLEVVVPEVSEGVTQGTVVSIAVAVGDEVEADQTLLELETDKAVVAIPSPSAGKVKEIRVAEGDTAEVGAVIAVLEDSGAASAPDKEPEQEDAPTATEQSAAEQPQAEEPQQKTAAAPPTQTAAAQPATKAEVDLHSVRRNELVAPAAPSVRRIARELGVDIYQVQGSGPGGRISEDDVRAFVRQSMQQLTGGGQAVSAAEFRGLHAQRTLPDFSKWGEVSRESLSKIREITADAMGYAWSTIPMVTQYDKARIDDLEAFRTRYNKESATEVKLTMTAILVKVCAVALKAFPHFNSSLDLAAKELVLKQYVHIGVAVDTPNGLMVPVIQDADQKGIVAIAEDLSELAAKTRERKVSPAELEGGTFTISNLGGIGGTAFTPIVYAPQVAILGVSRTAIEPVWNGQEFVPGQLMPLSLTYDHRVIDGADGARFLRFICAALEQPLKLLM